MFDFTVNRGRDGPKYFLKDYRQVLLADAYGGYNGVVAGNEITRAGCWAHMKRKVIDAEKAAPEIAREAVERVRALYAVERQCKDASVEERLELRQQQSAPMLALLREKLLEWKEQLLPKHPMAEAVIVGRQDWIGACRFSHVIPPCTCEWPCPGKGQEAYLPKTPTIRSARAIVSGTTRQRLSRSHLLRYVFQFGGGVDFSQDAMRLLIGTSEVSV